MQTVRDILKAEGHNGVHMMTPEGFVDLTGEQVKEVLAGSNTTGHPGCKGCNMEINSEELLKQFVVSTPNRDTDGSLCFITDWRK